MIRWEICKCQILSLIFVFTDYVIHPESPGVKFQMRAIGVGCRLEMLEWNKCDQQSERVCSGWESLQLGKSARTGNAALNEVNPKVLSFVLTRAFKNSWFFFIYICKSQSCAVVCQSWSCSHRNTAESPHCQRNRKSDIQQMVDSPPPSSLEWFLLQSIFLQNACR